MSILSELSESILWELRNSDIESTDPEWLSCADALLDQGLVVERDGIYSITKAGLSALKKAVDRIGILRG